MPVFAQFRISNHQIKANEVLFSKIWVLCLETSRLWSMNSYNSLIILSKIFQRNISYYIILWLQNDVTSSIFNQNCSNFAPKSPLVSYRSMYNLSESISANSADYWRKIATVNLLRIPSTQIIGIRILYYYYTLLTLSISLLLLVEVLTGTKIKHFAMLLNCPMVKYSREQFT